MRRSRALQLIALAGAVLLLWATLRPRTETVKNHISRTPGRYTNNKQREIVQAAVDTWEDYRQHGYGSDEFGPITKKTDPEGKKVLGWMIVDSLDTFMLMGLDDYVNESKQWISKLSYDIDETVNLFETTIRMLGGLLGAYHLSSDKLYLDKAIDLADRLLPAFSTSSNIPGPDINLKLGKVTNGIDSSTAEVSTLQLEFKYLSYLTGDQIYWDAVQNVMKRLDQNKPKDGLVPIHLNPNTGDYVRQEIRLGSRGDSYYEYLIKQYLQTSRQEPVYKQMYDESVAGIRKHLVAFSKPNNLLFIGERPSGVEGPFDTKMDHLVCFAGGMFALGATNGLALNAAREESWWTKQREEEFNLGKEITKTCYATYNGTETGLSPEIVVFNQDQDSKSDFYIKPLDYHNLQRPETVESLMILYRLTKDPIYREWGWNIFESFRNHTQLPDGSYTSLDSVKTGQKRDSLESFWLAETLKYLYLLFDDEDLISLDKNVFNTEAHPLPVIPKKFNTWNRK